MPQEMGLESQAFGYLNHFLGTEDSQARDFNAQLQAADSGLRAKARMHPWQSSHRQCCLQSLPASPAAGRSDGACLPPSCRRAGDGAGSVHGAGGEQSATAQAQPL